MPKFQLGETVRISGATKDIPQDASGHEGVVISLPEFGMDITRSEQREQPIDLEAIYEVEWDALEDSVFVKESDLTAV